MRTRLLQQTNVAWMEEIKAAADENNALSVVFPFAALENQVILRSDLRQSPAPLAIPETRKRLILSRAPSPLRSAQ
jgi:hypothetical protein